MIAAGYGERKLTNDCACEGSVKSNCTDAQHQSEQKNRIQDS
jgi:translation initiation factor 1 (eIF-1/SUI1)